MRGKLSDPPVDPTKARATADSAVHDLLEAVARLSKREQRAWKSAGRTAPSAASWSSRSDAHASATNMAHSATRIPAIDAFADDTGTAYVPLTTQHQAVRLRATDDLRVVWMTFVSEPGAKTHVEIMLDAPSDQQQVAAVNGNAIRPGVVELVFCFDLKAGQRSRLLDLVPSGAAITFCLRRTRGKFGILKLETEAAIASKPPVVKAALSAKELGDRLWSGFARDALPALERLRADTTQKAQQRAAAAWYLTQWTMVEEQYATALDHLELAQHCDSKPQQRYVLAAARCLMHLGRPREALARIESALQVNPHTDYRLLKSTVLRQAELAASHDIERVDATQLDALNEVFLQAGLAPLVKRDPRVPLSLGNVVAHAAPRSAEQRQKLSVIMPVFNGMDTIEWALASVLAQTWRNLEIIVVDDASTDATCEVVEAICPREPRVRLVRRAVNGGTYAARNLGLAHASGELVMIHDSDDWSHPQKLELQIEALRAMPDRVAVTSFCVRVGLHLEMLSSWFPGGALVGLSYSSLMCRRDLLTTIGAWDEVATGGDAELYERILARYGNDAIVCIAEACPLTLLLSRQDSLTQASATHQRTQEYGLRWNYIDAFRNWHRQLKQQPVAFDPRAPAFPGPLGNRVPRAPAELDLVVVADFALEGAPFTATLEYLLAAATAGKKVGIVHWRTYALPMRAPLQPALYRACHELEIAILSPSDQVRTLLVMLPMPAILQHKIDPLPQLDTKEVMVVADFLGSADTLQYYDAHTLRAHLRSLFGTEGLWLATTATCADAIQRDGRFPATLLRSAAEICAMLTASVRTETQRELSALPVTLTKARPMLDSAVYDLLESATQLSKREQRAWKSAGRTAPSAASWSSRSDAQPPATLMAHSAARIPAIDAFADDTGTAYAPLTMHHQPVRLQATNDTRVVWMTFVSEPGAKTHVEIVLDAATDCRQVAAVNGNAITAGVGERAVCFDLKAGQRSRLLDLLPSGAAITFCLRRTRGKFGVLKLETAAVGLEAANLAVKENELTAWDLGYHLWAGFARYALPALERMRADTTQRARHRATAAWYLAEWSVVEEDYATALDHLEFAQHEATALEPRLVLAAARCLMKLGRYRQALTTLATATQVNPLADYQLLESTVRRATGLAAGDALPRIEAAQLEALNAVFLRAGLAPLTKRDASAPLSLANLEAHAEPRRVEQQQKVSVIVPAFNAMHTIEWAVGSVLAQTWRNLEIIVVDDASTDATCEVVQALCSRDSRVRLLRQSRNGGAYVARNVGLAHASGELVMAHDSDDWSHPQQLELQIETLNATTGCVAVDSFWVRVGEHLEIVGTWTPMPFLIEPNHSSLLCRRELFTTVGPWDGVAVGADSEFYGRIHAIYGEGSVAHILQACPLALSLTREESLTRAKATHQRTARYGLRRNYRDAFEYWHRQLQQQPPATALEPQTRAFVAPLGNRVRRAAADFDLVMVADFALDGAPITVTLEYLLAAATSGRRVAILHWRTYALRPRAPLHPELYRACLEQRIAILSPGDEVRTQLVMFPTPAILQYRVEPLPQLSAADVVVLADALDSRDDLQSYDASTMRAHLRSLFGTDGRWLATTAAVRDAMQSDGRFPPVLLQSSAEICALLEGLNERS